MNPVPLELKEILGSANDELPDVEPDAPDAFDKFLDEAALAGATNMGKSAAQHVEGFRAEVARLDAPLKTHFAKLASAATPARSAPADPTRLEKRANGKTIEETVYPSGAKVVAEMMDGLVVKTYMVPA